MTAAGNITPQHALGPVQARAAVPTRCFVLIEHERQRIYAQWPQSGGRVGVVEHVPVSALHIVLQPWLQPRLQQLAGNVPQSCAHCCQYRSRKLACPRPRRSYPQSRTHLVHHQCRCCCRH
jgi:hypothetical protein